MSTAFHRSAVLPLLLLCACGAQPPAPAAGPTNRAGPTGVASASAPAPEAAVATPDPARVYADLLGRTEDFPRVKGSPKEFEGRNVVLYGVRAGDLRAVETRFSMPLASTDGRTTIPATERPTNNQFYLVLSDDFAREARERRMLTGGAARGPLFVECKIVAQAAGRVTSYACEVEKLVSIVNDRVAESLWRGRGGTLDYYRY
jgi:hypothetical protein